MIKKNYIHMGTITRPHGIKGELCVDWYADSPNPLKKTFYLQIGSEPMQSISGAKVRMHKGRPLLTLPHITDRNGAEALRGMSIYIERESLPPLSDDEAYLHDIIGLNIVEHESDTHIGVLEAVEFPSEQMLWVIRTHDDKEILLPAVEEFIISFDLELEEIRVSPPEGLLELYLADSEKPPKKKNARTARS